MSLPLAGVRVLDGTTRLAGAYATKMLRDVGADVVIVETAEHPLRTRVAPGVSLPPGEDAALWRWLQGGKRSVDADAGETLAAVADIVVSDDPSMPAVREGGVAVSITDYGLSGPWASRPSSHLTLEAESGSLASRGIPELPPVAVGGDLGEWIAGLYAGLAAIAAWRGARMSGLTERVEVSAFECMLVTLNMHEPLHAALAGSDAFTRWIQVPSIEPTADGWVCFSLVTGQQWLDFAAMVGRPELGEDPGLSNMLGRWPRREEVYAAYRPWLAARDVATIVDAATSFRLPVAHVTDGRTVTAMDHFHAREVFTRSPHGDYLQPKPPYRFSAMTAAPAAPAPAAGGDGADVAAAWREPRTVRATSPRRPLDGVRVVDLTAFWAGPSGTGYLTALGADVVKVESIQRPDGIRFAGGQVTQADGWWDYSWVFQGSNAGKRGITLDLTRDEGRELLHRLLETADVLTENFSPRVLAQFGLTWEDLSRRYPRLVVTRMPAFGLDGPWANRVGFALTMEAVGGMASITGHPDGPPTCPGGVLDPIAGMHAAFATIAALEHREQTGHGQLVEVPMIECALNVGAEPMLTWGAHGVLVERRGNRGGVGVVQDVYAALGDDEWVAVTVATPKQAAAVLALLGGDDVDASLRTFVASSPADDAVDKLSGMGVPAGVVRRPTVAGDNPHVRARSFYERHEHPAIGAVDYPVLPTRFANWSGQVHTRPAPMLGEHNQEILGGELGLTDAQLADLEARAVIGRRPVGL